MPQLISVSSNTLQSLFESQNELMCLFSTGALCPVSSECVLCQYAVAEDINEEWKLRNSDCPSLPSPLQAKSISMDRSALINKENKIALNAGTVLRDLCYNNLHLVMAVLRADLCSTVKSDVTLEKYHQCSTHNFRVSSNWALGERNVEFFCFYILMLITKGFYPGISGVNL